MDLFTKLQTENETLKSKIKVQEEKIQSLEKLNDWYIEQLKLRNKEKFGSSSEKADKNQLSLFDLFNEAETLREPITVEPTEETLIPSHKRKKAKRGSSLSNLPVETIEYKLSDEEKVCDICGNILTEMKKEIRKEIKVVPAQVSIVEHVTYVYSCRKCDKEGTEGFIKTADSPKALIKKSMVSPSMMAYILNQKYTNAMPLYRQEQEFNRLGVELTRQNLSNWTIKGADLLKPLVQEMKANLLLEELLHADETILEVLNEPGRDATTNSYMWLYRTSANSANPIIIFDYKEGRNGIYAKSFLKDWKGKYLHCDGYGGYKKLENITLCGCLVHAKRKFHEAWKASINKEDAKIGEEYIQNSLLLKQRLII